MINDWAVNFNLTVVRAEERPDNPQGDIVYRLKDLFTTRDGSWEPSNRPGSVTDWARNLYLRPWGAPDYFDDAGGDHHIFARVLDMNGEPMKDRDLIMAWSDGLNKLADSGYDNYVHVTPKDKSGWGNVVLFNSFSPERGEKGAWCWCPKGAADVVVGGGLPNNLHVSFFAVWQAERRDANVVVPPVDGGGDQSPVTSLDELRSAAWDAVGVPFNRDSAFANYARINGLGGPLTNEFEIGGFVAQGFANGIVYAPKGQWQAIDHMGW